MLITCPECGLPASDKALACPHCGYPIKDQPKEYKRKPKRRRLPNGFGQISEIKNRNLARPFRACVTVGYNEQGRPITKNLKPCAYFETYNEAYAALVKYAASPYDLTKRTTVQELYAAWSPKKFESLGSQSRINQIRSAWTHCTSLYGVQVCAIRPRHIKQCIDGCSTASVKSNVKILLNMLLDYAVEYEIVDRNYARAVSLEKKVTENLRTAQKEHIPFTDEEMGVLWANLGKYPEIDMLLIQCYSGWRPQELLTLECKNIDLTNGSMTGGMKTEAGKNRVVPIHPAVFELIKARYDPAHRFLFGADKALSMRTYLRHFEQLMKALGLNPDHRPHDGRKHFVTMAKKYNVDEYAIKYIVGHTISDLTERVYTARDFSWLKAEICKIK